LEVLILEDFKSLFPEVLILGDFKSLSPEVLILVGFKSFLMNEIQKSEKILEVLILEDLTAMWPKDAGVERWERKEIKSGRE
jgi:hypothetical protein